VILIKLYYEKEEYEGKAYYLLSANSILML